MQACFACVDCCMAELEIKNVLILKLGVAVCVQSCYNREQV